MQWTFQFTWMDQGYSDNLLVLPFDKAIVIILEHLPLIVIAIRKLFEETFV